MSAFSPPECLACGACCFGEGERYVPVSGDDHARLGELAETYTQFLGNRCYMRMVDGHCAALRLELDGRGNGRYVCGLYAERPQTCRDRARGGGACRAELEAKHSVAQRGLLRVVTGPAASPSTSPASRVARSAWRGP